MKTRVDGVARWWRDGILAGGLTVLLLAGLPLGAMARQDPDLPKGDGTGDVPDMFIRLVPLAAATAATARDTPRP